MPKVILPLPIEETVPLNLPAEQDPDQVAAVGVRQATTAEQEMISKINADAEQTLDAERGLVFRTKRISIYELRRKQAFLTLTSCNLYLPDPSDPGDQDKAEPAFRFRRIDGKVRVDMKPEEFDSVWGRLPIEWTDAIGTAVLKVNKQWDPEYQGE
jgi:hypothetical protein